MVTLIVNIVNDNMQQVDAVTLYNQIKARLNGYAPSAVIRGKIIAELE